MASISSIGGAPSCLGHAKIPAGCRDLVEQLGDALVIPAQPLPRRAAVAPLDFDRAGQIGCQHIPQRIEIAAEMLREAKLLRQRVVDGGQARLGLAIENATPGHCGTG
jgi:hypothetical protein